MSDLRTLEVVVAVGEVDDVAKELDVGSEVEVVVKEGQGVIELSVR